MTGLTMPQGIEAMTEAATSAMTTEAASMTGATSMTGVRTGGTGVAMVQALNKKTGVAASGTAAALTMVASVGHVMRGRAGGAVSPKPHSPVLQAMDLQVVLAARIQVPNWSVAQVT